MTEDEIEMELEFVREDDPDPTAFHVHLDCFAALERERQKLEVTARTRKPAGKPVARGKAKGGPSLKRG